MLQIFTARDSCKYHRLFLFGQIFFIYAWISNLPNTDSFFSVYAFFALSGILCLFDNYHKQPILSPKVTLSIAVFSTLFSLSAILGNHALFVPYTALMNLFNMALCFIGGFFIGFHILLCMLTNLPLKPVQTERRYANVFFMVSFFSILCVDLLYLFTTNYPAIINYDAMEQFSQINGLSAYSNWTPYWHTKTLEFFLKIGFSLFNNPNSAVAFYEVCQVIFIAAVLAYTLVTLYQLGLPKLPLCVASFLYILLPYNIVFNVTIGKDVLFGVGLLLYITAFLRILCGTGKSTLLNYIAFSAGSLGFSLWRTNGWYIYLISAILFLFFIKQRKKVLIFVMVCILAVGWFLLNPYLESRNIGEAPVYETMAVPFQQVARVIVNEREISEEDEAFLSEIFYLDQFPALYEPGSVDPIKFDAFRQDKQAFFKDNFGTFVQIWLRLGFRYPGDYLLAWADETRGYWNGGYHMGVYDQGVPDNSMGMYNIGGDGIFAKLFAAYFRYIEDPIILEPLKSIGFVVWLVLACWWVNILKKRRNGFIFVPVLILLAGLWVGTPVFAEFRYGYPIFLASPLLLFTTTHQLEPKETSSNK